MDRFDLDKAKTIYNINQSKSVSAPSAWEYRLPSTSTPQLATMHFTVLSSLNTVLSFIRDQVSSYYSTRQQQCYNRLSLFRIIFQLWNSVFLSQYFIISISISQISASANRVIVCYDKKILFDTKKSCS